MATAARRWCRSLVVVIIAPALEMVAGRRDPGDPLAKRRRYVLHPQIPAKGRLGLSLSLERVLPQWHPLSKMENDRGRVVRESALKAFYAFGVARWPE